MKGFRSFFVALVFVMALPAFGQKKPTPKAETAVGATVGVLSGTRGTFSTSDNKVPDPQMQEGDRLAYLKDLIRIISSQDVVFIGFPVGTTDVVSEDSPPKWKKVSFMVERSLKGLSAKDFPDTSTLTVFVSVNEVSTSGLSSLVMASREKVPTPLRGQIGAETMIVGSSVRSLATVASSILDSIGTFEDAKTSP